MRLPVILPDATIAPVRAVALRLSFAETIRVLPLSLTVTFPVPFTSVRVPTLAVALDVIVTAPLLLSVFTVRVALSAPSTTFFAIVLGKRASASVPEVKVLIETAAFRVVAAAALPAALPLMFASTRSFVLL